jgi:hypothetical protein
MDSTPPGVASRSNNVGLKPKVGHPSASGGLGLLSNGHNWGCSGGGPRCHIRQLAEPSTLVPGPHTVNHLPEQVGPTGKPGTIQKRWRMPRASWWMMMSLVHTHANVNAHKYSHTRTHQLVQRHCDHILHGGGVGYGLSGKGP